MAFLDQQETPYRVPNVSLVHKMADYRYTGKCRLPSLSARFKIRLLNQAFSHGPCWKVDLSSARLLFRTCLAIAKC